MLDFPQKTEFYPVFRFHNKFLVRLKCLPRVVGQLREVLVVHHVLEVVVADAGGNCIKLGLPGKSILGDYFHENRTSRRPFLLLRISFPGGPINIQIIPGRRGPVEVALYQFCVSAELLRSHVLQLNVDKTRACLVQLV